MAQIHMLGTFVALFLQFSCNASARNSIAGHEYGNYICLCCVCDADVVHFRNQNNPEVIPEVLE